MKIDLKYYLNAALNSYAILFFSQNKILGALLFLVSMFNFNAGISGLMCLCSALVITSVLGFNKEDIKAGLYSFNALLLGIGFGTFFSFNYTFWLWLAAATLLCVVLSVNLTSFLGKYALPTLSIPFVITFWLLLIAASGYSGMGLVQKESSLIFELTTIEPGKFQKLCNFFDNLAMPKYLELFFRSVSAVLFQNSVLAGILVSIGFFIHSRIGFSLLVLGFVVACLINHFTGTYPEGISNYHLGANFMMVSCAIGGFFLIPSWRSYLWAIVIIPFTFLVLNGLSRILGTYNLPVFSMPFCIVTISVLYFFMLRKNAGKLQLTIFQNYSPETNLYQFLNGSERLKDFRYFNIGLPFMGSWTVSQGYDGAITHQGEWNQALDFVLKDIDDRTYEFPGLKPEDYYCFNKPILAVANGWIQECVNHIDDNVIGQVNLTQNWGNTIIIKHAEGLFSKVSHLKKNSIKVKVGDYVSKGDVIALCGNSGRSPEPHLHFQLQSTPYIGSKTLAYPISYFVNEKKRELISFDVPKLDDVISNPEVNVYLKSAFNFLPGYSVKVSDGEKTESWEIFTDASNSTYFYCYGNQSTAYFVNNDNVFYFTRFYGDTKSILNVFYRSAYKVNFSGHDAEDIYAIDSAQFKPKLWLQDLLAPFWGFTKLSYQNKLEATPDGFLINAEANSQFFHQKNQLFTSVLKIDKQGINSFEIVFKNKKTTVKWRVD
ncbi:urea transporter [Pedobacter aquatilis]|uniref:urea transporter n=1 Tax=Pedobacter aquatilis TaxID=351343 RepID=UPI00292EDB52|nr:urea transporter [Pedobacter aquatilis]